MCHPGFALELTVVVVAVGGFVIFEAFEAATVLAALDTGGGMLGRAIAADF